MIVESIITIACVAAVAGIANMLCIGKKNYNKISFKETFDLLNAPIITFNFNNIRKLHFLLDTGSNLSHIRPDVVDKLPLDIQKHNNSSMTASGVSMVSKGKCSIPLSYKDKQYIANFLITEEVASSLGVLKRDFNLDVHGILGCDFLDKYNYVVDFKDLTAYSRK